MYCRSMNTCAPGTSESIRSRPAAGAGSAAEAAAGAPAAAPSLTVGRRAPRDAPARGSPAGAGGPALVPEVLVDGLGAPKARGSVPSGRARAGQKTTAAPPTRSAAPRATTSTRTFICSGLYLGKRDHVAVRICERELRRAVPLLLERHHDSHAILQLLVCLANARHVDEERQA